MRQFVDQTLRASRDDLQLDVMLESVTKSISEAVRSLQFEDTATQILNASVQRVERMGACSVRAVQIMERSQNGDRLGPLRALVEALRTLGERVAVHQSTVEQGSVELF